MKDDMIFSFKVSSQHLKSLRKGHIYIVTYSLSKNNGLNMTWCIFLSLSWSLIIWHHFKSWKLWVWSPMVDLHFLYKKILNCTFCQILYNLKCLMVFPWIYIEIRAAFYKKKHEQTNKCLLIINWLTYAYPHIHVQIKALGPPT